MQNKIKNRRRLERGCNFPHAMSSIKYPSGASGTIGRYHSIYPYVY